ncbi:unnamed protein product [Schistosoma margrebowiei]|uniref:Uncharacterized protein n=1 Tax=Schistosoma margrebowiei TaxID=48269 RepID=A0A183N6V6_9TREM|nr:unnamed protein product [Schistosoma margrebowiei]
MVVGGSQQETLDPGFVLLGTRYPEGTSAPWRIRSRVAQLHVPGGIDSNMSLGSSSSSSSNSSFTTSSIGIIYGGILIFVP